VPAIPAPKITPGLVAAHGLTPDECEPILAFLGRALNFTEFGILSAMSNEHYSDKLSPNPEFIEGRDANDARASK
jgi:hypothetical protein